MENVPEIQPSRFCSVHVLTYFYHVITELYVTKASPIYLQANGVLSYVINRYTYNRTCRVQSLRVILTKLRLRVIYA